MGSDAKKIKNKSEEQEKREETGFYYSFASQFSLHYAPFSEPESGKIDKRFCDV